MSLHFRYFSPGCQAITLVDLFSLSEISVKHSVTYRYYQVASVQKKEEASFTVIVLPFISNSTPPDFSSIFKTSDKLSELGIEPV